MPEGRPVTFLFTDIEGSTPLWERARGEMQQAVARHETILAGAIERNHGRLVKTMGDGLYAVFEDPGEAVQAAAGAMQDLIREDWPPETPIRVRMGVHTGEAQERGGDYFGPSVNRAARLMGVGHGEQIVISGATEQRLGNHLPEGMTLNDLGEVRLRGLATPEHAYQLMADYLPSQFPPLVGTDIPTNLPATPTTFVGRAADVAAIQALIGEQRLVTLVGFGGTGKTRLAIEIAADCMAWYPDGVWFVDLVPIQSPDRVAQAVATALAIPEAPGADMMDTIATHIGDDRTLLVLDNCEHVIDGAAKLVDRLASSTTQLRVIATSRAPLVVSGETIYDVEPLDATDDGPAIQLFLDRARAVRAGFAPSPSHMEHIAHIVGRLDGIPLAIELAAARIRTMDPPQIDQHLDDRFGLLTGGSRAAEPRQQTLRALVAWSYDLLTEEERRLFNRLSVFAGDFTLDAAGEVAGEPGGVVAPFDLLASLVDQSLVRRRASEAELRFDLLETLRQFGEEQLAATGEANEFRERHARFFAERSQDADELLKGPDQKTWHERLTADEPDLLQALDWQAEHDPEAGLEMASQLSRLWYRRAMVTTGLATTQAALAAAPLAPTAARARALAWEGYFMDLQGDRAGARVRVTSALEIADGLGDSAIKAQALNSLGAFADKNGALREAVDLWHEALAELDAVKSQWVTAPLFNLGYGLVELGDVAAARPIVQRLIDLGTNADDQWTRTIGQLLDAHVSFATGQLDEADTGALTALASFKEQGAVFHAGEACILRASVAELRGDLQTARREMDAARETLTDTDIFEQAEARLLAARIALRAGDLEQASADLGAAISANTADDSSSSRVRILHEAARLAEARGDLEAAARLVAASTRALEVAGASPPAHQASEVTAILVSADASLGADAASRAQAEGAGWSPESAMAAAGRVTES